MCTKLEELVGKGGGGWQHQIYVKKKRTVKPYGREGAYRHVQSLVMKLNKDSYGTTLPITFGNFIATHLESK